MSLAMYAAPFNNDNSNDNYDNSQQDTPINRKRANNKTQKRMTTDNYNQQKVDSVLESLHNSPSSDSNALGDFNLIPPPSSAGVENTILKENTKANGMNNQHSNQKQNPYNNNKVTEGMTNQNNGINYSKLNGVEYDTDEVDINSLSSNYMNDKVVEQYYKNLLPTYESKYKKSEHNKPYYSIPSQNNNDFESDNYRLLTDKLNYVINLLEEQQDEKTNNVMEEVVLYSFLGIFIIFIVDSFARVGKYVR